MGVTGLWTILAPVKEHKELGSLQGETVAVDLSIWVCETQCVKKMQSIVSKPYLRNLFFRVNHLTQLGVKLVFVVDGQAPEIKWEVMSRRNQALGRGTRVGKGHRSNFNRYLKECCELLDILGIPYIQSKGEAESLCAALNSSGLVDACITDDGDAFLYGAKKVYRNFTMNTKDPHVESYNMASVETNLGLNQQKLVAMALLLGCDYLPGGVHGVGLERVIKLMASLSHMDVLKRFEKWASITPEECVDKIELFVRRKALAVPGFPQKEVISEFLNSREIIPSKQFSWKRPLIQRAQNFAEVKLEWPPEYTLEKLLPLVTLWDMTHILHSEIKPLYHLKPHRIVKARVQHGVSVYEVEWHKDASYLSYPKDYYTTREEQCLFNQCFPDVVLKYVADLEEAKRNRKQGGRKKNVHDPCVDELVSKLSSVNLDTLPAACQTSKKTADSDYVLCDTKKNKEIANKKTGTSAKDNKKKTKTMNKKQHEEGTDFKHKSNNTVYEHPVSHTVKSSSTVVQMYSHSIEPISNEAQPDSEDKQPKLYKVKRSSEYGTDSDHGDSDEEVFLTLTQRLQLKLEGSDKSFHLTGSKDFHQLTSKSLSELSSGSSLKECNSNKSDEILNVYVNENYKPKSVLDLSQENKRFNRIVKNKHRSVSCLSDTHSTIEESNIAKNTTAWLNIETFNSGETKSFKQNMKKNKSLDTGCHDSPFKQSEIKNNAYFDGIELYSSEVYPADNMLHDTEYCVVQAVAPFTESSCLSSKKKFEAVEENDELHRNNKSLSLITTPVSFDDFICALEMKSIFETPKLNCSENEMSYAFSRTENSFSSFKSVDQDNYLDSLDDCSPESNTSSTGNSLKPVSDFQSSLSLIKIPISCHSRTPVSQKGSNYRRFLLTSVQNNIPFNESVDNTSPLLSYNRLINTSFEFGEFNMQASLLNDFSQLVSPNAGDNGLANNCNDHQEKITAYLESPLLFDTTTSSFNVANEQSPICVSVSNTRQVRHLTDIKLKKENELTADTWPKNKVGSSFNNLYDLPVSGHGKISMNETKKDFSVPRHKDAEEISCCDNMMKKDSLKDKWNENEAMYSNDLAITCNELPNFGKCTDEKSTSLCIENYGKYKILPQSGHSKEPNVDKMKIEQHNTDSEKGINCIYCFSAKGVFPVDPTSMKNVVCEHDCNIISSKSQTKARLERTFCPADDSLTEKDSPLPLTLADRLKRCLTKNAQLTLRNMSQK